MKGPIILMIVSAAFSAACQTKAKSPEMSFAKNFARVNALVTPTPIPARTPEPAFNIHSKIGIADVVSDGTGCLRTKNANLAEKTPVSIIISLAEPPQKVLTATVGKKLNESCARRASETGDRNLGENFFYTLNLNEEETEEIGFEVGIAVIRTPKPIQVQNNLASVDLDEDGKPEFFRRCGGFEGIHFTIWTGTPLKGKRIWHSFYYLDYDTQENCNNKDWKGTGN
jgi:hypothetical protein